MSARHHDDDTERKLRKADRLGLRDRPDVIKMLKKEATLLPKDASERPILITRVVTGEEATDIRFTGNVVKINRREKEKENRLILTKTSIFCVAPGRYKVLRRILLTKVEAITVRSSKEASVVRYGIFTTARRTTELVLDNNDNEEEEGQEDDEMSDDEMEDDSEGGIDEAPSEAGPFENSHSLDPPRIAASKSIEAYNDDDSNDTSSGNMKKEQKKRDPNSILEAMSPPGDVFPSFAAAEHRYHGDEGDDGNNPNKDVGKKKKKNKKEIKTANEREQRRRRGGERDTTQQMPHPPGRAKSDEHHSSRLMKGTGLRSTGTRTIDDTDDDDDDDGDSDDPDDWEYDDADSKSERLQKRGGNRTGRRPRQRRHTSGLRKGFMKFLNKFRPNSSKKEDIEAGMEGGKHVDDQNGGSRTRRQRHYSRSPSKHRNTTTALDYEHHHHQQQQNRNGRHRDRPQSLPHQRQQQEDVRHHCPLQHYNNESQSLPTEAAITNTNNNHENCHQYSRWRAGGDHTTRPLVRPPPLIPQKQKQQPHGYDDDDHSSGLFGLLLESTKSALSSIGGGVSSKNSKTAPPAAATAAFAGGGSSRRLGGGGGGGGGGGTEVGKTDHVADELRGDDEAQTGKMMKKRIKKKKKKKKKKKAQRITLDINQKGRQKR
eukprot:jgi/Bigna1/127383/aug1.4_g2091